METTNTPTAAAMEALQKELAMLTADTTATTTGTVVRSSDGVATVEGLSSIRMGEMVTFESGDVGIVFNLEEYATGVVLLTSGLAVAEGMKATATGKILSVPVGPGFIGRVVDALGQPLDGRGAIDSAATYPVEKIAPGVMARKSVSQPMLTGIKGIDALIPVGRGQRELIIGDRQTGKTAIAIDAILNQHDQDMVCVYVSIGQKDAKLARLVEELSARDAMKYTVIVASNASSSAASQYIAPYSATAIAEYFMDQGKDVLVIYDDLSKHAVAYREISLLLRRPPGREAYPGDVFYLHSRLLERSARLDKGGSITSLPIIETAAGDVSAYIPTNVISITDGQIFLDTSLFASGLRPAVNVGTSVSRVGGSAQTKLTKKVAGSLKLELAQFRDLAAFSQFASDLDEATRSKLERGKRLTELLKQDLYSPVPMEIQAVVFYAGTRGYLDSVAVADVRRYELELTAYLKATHAELLKKLRDTKELSAENEAGIKEALAAFKDRFQA